VLYLYLLFDIAQWRAENLGGNSNGRAQIMFEGGSGLAINASGRPASCQNELNMTTRLLWALGIYAVLALMAAFTLDGNLRLAVWILLAGLTVKTVIAYKAGW
jgi:hypothetical protein